MEIYYQNSQLETLCNSEKELTRKYGSANSKHIKRRFVQLRAFANLGDLLGSGLGGCHQLTRERAGQFAVKLSGGYRLVFKPADDPVPLKPDGAMDTKSVTKIRILEITDYHD